MLTIKTKTKEYKNISNPKDDIRSQMYSGASHVLLQVCDKYGRKTHRIAILAKNIVDIKEQ